VEQVELGSWGVGETGPQIRIHMCIAGTETAIQTGAIKNAVSPPPVAYCQLVFTWELAVAVEHAHVVATPSLRLAFCLAHGNLRRSGPPAGPLQRLQVERHAVQGVPARKQSTNSMYFCFYRERISQPIMIYKLK